MAQVEPAGLVLNQQDEFTGEHYRAITANAVWFNVMLITFEISAFGMVLASLMNVFLVLGITAYLEPITFGEGMHTAELIGLVAITLLFALMFMLVSRRYERASLIVTSNKPFSGWGEIFGDDVTAAAMIDRLVHHAEILALKGDSYRLKDRDLARATPTDS